MLWLISTPVDLWFGVRQAGCSIKDQASVASRICGFPMAAIRIRSKSTLGLIVVGLRDNSVIPIPGGLDVFTILRTGHHHARWAYYGAMAALGAVSGGLVTYRPARKAGKAALEKKIGRRRAERVYPKFEKNGFTAVFLGSVIPPRSRWCPF